MPGHNKIKHIGFISTRFQGTDGVSLETMKWCSVLENMGYTCYFFAGLSDWPPQKTMVVPEAFFQDPQIVNIQSQCFGRVIRSPQLTEDIHRLRIQLKQALYRFIEQYDIDLIVPENALAIPMNIPLGLAITEFIAETGIPTIAHHHDFYWERLRFTVNCISDFLSMAFPPALPSMQHAVINSPGSQSLSYRKGLSSEVVPNVLNFAEPAPSEDDYNADVRAALGLEPEDLFILQPTRIVARKGIEHSIEIVHRLNNPRAKLVISHAAGDEGFEFEERIRNYARLMNVPLIVRPDIISTERGFTPEQNKIYNLWDIYPYADLVLYPSIYEGFGNALVEAIYFKKPLVVNRYPIYVSDIEPAGFHLMAMNGCVTDEIIEQILHILSHPKEKERMVETNYRIASRFFSYEILTQKLTKMLGSFGEM